MELKTFIQTFEFTKDDFSRLPDGFPYCNLEGLTKAESNIYSGIVLAWYNTPDGQKALIRKITKPAGTALVLIIGLMGLISLITSDSGEFTRTVNAATQVADEVIQSTMSAILRK